MFFRIIAILFLFAIAPHQLHAQVESANYDLGVRFVGDDEFVALDQFEATQDAEFRVEPYAVESGQTLYDILEQRRIRADAYSYDFVLSLNPTIVDPGALVAGQSIYVPTVVISNWADSQASVSLLPVYDTRVAIAAEVSAAEAVVTRWAAEPFAMDEQAEAVYAIQGDLQSLSAFYAAELSSENHNPPSIIVQYRDEVSDLHNTLAQTDRSDIGALRSASIEAAALWTDRSNYGNPENRRLVETTVVAPDGAAVPGNFTTYWIGLTKLNRIFVEHRTGAILPSDRLVEFTADQQNVHELGNPRPPILSPGRLCFVGIRWEDRLATGFKCVTVEEFLNSDNPMIVTLRLGAE